MWPKIRSLIGIIMKRWIATSALIMSLCSPFTYAESEDLAQQVALLKAQTEQLQKQLQSLQTQLQHQAKHTKSAAKVKSDAVGVSPDSLHAPVSDNRNRLNTVKSKHKIKPIAPAGITRTPIVEPDASVHDSQVIVRAMEIDPESVDFYPTALVADGRVLTYIAGTPVVSSPYLGSRPAFDGSDYIVNISSINRDIRLMQQRRNLYRAYEKEGYTAPNMPIIMLSGKAEPMGYLGQNYTNTNIGDWTFASSELDVAAFLNDKVEGYMGIAYNQAPPPGGGQRVANSVFGLNMGFINIGDLDESPYYLTAGQLFAPFGRYSTGMVSAPLTMIFSRTRTRPLILGYKSQSDSGPFAAAYAFRSDTDLGNHSAGGLNWGYIKNANDFTGEFGISVISSVDDASGMQYAGSNAIENTFAGFASPFNGNEQVKKTPAGGLHTTISFDRYNLTAEWVTTLTSFRPEDLSFNGSGVMGSAGQLEAGMTFMAFNRPAGLAFGYQWTNQLLALNLPQQRFLGTFNISIWKDTVESLEYRHDIDYGSNNYANGAAPSGSVNANTIGTGGTYDMLSAQIGVYF
jgi:hypothetical protein